MTEAVSVQILRLPHAEGLPLPAYETAGSAGMDLRAAVPAEAYISLIADGEAHRLYAQYGFQPTAPASIGMALFLRPNDA